MVFYCFMRDGHAGDWLGCIRLIWFVRQCVSGSQFENSGLFSTFQVVDIISWVYPLHMLKEFSACHPYAHLFSQFSSQLDFIICLVVTKEVDVCICV
jgi:hypothetical protein